MLHHFHGFHTCLQTFEGVLNELFPLIDGVPGVVAPFEDFGTGVVTMVAVCFVLMYVAW